MLLISFLKLNRPYLSSIPRSLFYNIKLLGIRRGIRCPFFFSNSTRVSIRNSKVEFKSSLHAGMIKFGFTTCSFIPKEIYKSTFTIADANLELHGAATFGAGSHLSVENQALLSIGSNVWGTGKITLLCRSHTILEDNVVMAWDITIMDHDAHRIISAGESLRTDKSPVTIGKHVWIGHSCSLKKGVSISSNTVIGANSVVTKSLERSNALYCGIPARLIRTNIEW